MDKYTHACIEIASMLNHELDDRSINKIIKNVSSKYALSSLPKRSDILKYVNDEHIRHLLTVRPSRSASGVIVISAMPMPYPCPHGRCIYCPGGIEINTANSYTNTSPASIAAQRYNFDPYMQVKSKLDKFNEFGHDISKVEIVIVGGTFLFMPRDYQEYFIKSCYDALNGFKANTLEEAIQYNEQAYSRNVGLTIETKPDYCKKQHIDLMLRYGATKVEIGVQSLSNKVYQLVNRGHTLDDVIEAFQIARDAGYKIVAHMMPGLPGSSLEQDYNDFMLLFNDDRFKPDMLKLYPTLVIEGTGLYQLYKEGKYKPYTEEEMIELLAKVKSRVPRWIRIMRMQREVDSKEIIAGVKHGNLRQLVLAKLAREGKKCNCIRCREAGLKNAKINDPKIMREEYDASNGKEYFISIEDDDILLGFLRLRIPSSNAHRDEIKGYRCCIVRELHVYGRALALGEKDSKSHQHKGYGSMLMQEAENIALSNNLEKILVISAVGTREYYRRLGYKLEGAYMVKYL
ncbi:MAG: tRNA uridine(34) 5-carboxymethylaminomethyl modification radical SAM/GNAT enzyme Elp3 [Candidatus Nitrosothermus koennekii]|nr:MAG: tRNA uridine(34) 5-carboxymethylaminomethyl modification radical SAM/GNAT enzyme Elp3 [Candidatus Nitrosothermus koennekii]